MKTSGSDLSPGVCSRRGKKRCTTGGQAAVKPAKNQNFWYRVHWHNLLDREQRFPETVKGERGKNEWVDIALEKDSGRTGRRNKNKGREPTWLASKVVFLQKEPIGHGKKQGLREFAGGLGQV